MTDSHRYLPADAEEMEFWRRLHEVIVSALRRLVDDAGPEIAQIVAEELDAGGGG